MGKFKVLYEENSEEIIEKKSRFIAYLKPVESEEEATAFIGAVKKKHWDARHNCSAVVIGKNNEFTRCSDDGEPAQTAGKPMLEVLLGEQVHNMAAVVTRYFGGVLLGTGGLVRAYQGAVKKALSTAKIIEKTEGYELTVRTDYTDFGKLQYLFATEQLPVTDTCYAEDVTVVVMAEEERVSEIEKKITESTGGRAQIDRSQRMQYGILDGQVLR